MGAPPSFSGRVKAMVAFCCPAVADVIVGASGTVIVGGTGTVIAAPAPAATSDDPASATAPSPAQRLAARFREPVVDPPIRDPPRASNLTGVVPV